MEPCTVKPVKKYDRPPLSNTTLALHGLDTIGGPVHISNHRFFPKLPPELGFEETVERLKSALAEALGLFPPVAGIVRFNERNEFTIHCNDEGALLLVESRDTIFEADADHVSPRPVPVLPTPTQVLAVKVTKFSCGTIAVATSIHHAVTDLAGFVSFLEVWASIARGDAVDLSILPTTWEHSPARFFARPTSPPPSPPPRGYRVLPLPPTEVPFFPEAEAQNWVISAESLAQLKADFSTGSDGWISSGDALAALLWGAITRAREAAKIPRVGGMGRSSEESGVETIAMAADGRHRSTSKEITNGIYLGNLNLLFHTTCPRADLLSHDKDAGARVALALRRSLTEQLSAEAVPDRIRFFEDTANTVPTGRITWSADAIATNWAGVDLESDKMSFGWGRPFLTTAGGGPVPGGFFRILQNKTANELRILIAVEKAAAPAMSQDLAFTKYARFEGGPPVIGAYA